MEQNPKNNAPSLQFRPSREELDAWNGQLGELREDTGLDACMKVLACVAGHDGAMRMDRPQRVACRRALDWLETLRARLDEANTELGALRLLEYETGCADSDGGLIKGTERTMYMAYNARTVPDGEAERILKSGRQDMDPRVVVLWPEQAKALFPDMNERTEGDDAGCAE